MDIKGFTLVNGEKVNRAIFGGITQGGSYDGKGVGEDAKPEEILAAYDRLGGLILKDGKKVKMGSFYDFEKKAPRAKPKVKFVFRDLEGETVEIAEGEKIPAEVVAAEKIKKNKAAKAKAAEEKKEAAKTAAKKGKAKPKDADEEEEEEDEEESEDGSDDEE